MHKPYKTPAAKASADVKIPEPRVSKAVLFIVRIFVRFYLFLFYGIAKTVLRGEDALIHSFKRALAGESRCIIAFRHPNGGEPQLLSWFFLFKLRSLAARRGLKFARRPHAVFVYGYEVVRWGGWVTRLVMPNLGAMPVYHSKIDSRGMARIYKAILGGPYPVAMAPEGQVSYTTDSVPRLESGAIRIGFSAAEKLAASAEALPVEILPVAVHFRFGPWGKFTLELLVKKIERCTGSGAGRGAAIGAGRAAIGAGRTGTASRGARPLSFGERLQPCREHILEVNEKRYNLTAGAGLPYEERLDAIIGAALETAEGILGLRSQGDFFARMYYLRQICWDRLILPEMDEKAMERMSAVERGAADLRAGEAWHASRHLELLDFAWYFRLPLPADDAPLHHKIEYAQNLWDFANRTMGGAYSDRISIFPRRVIIQAAPPISLSDRLPAYKEDRKAAVAAAMADLMNAYLECIDEVNTHEAEL